MRRCEANVSYLAAEYLRVKSKSTIGFPTLRWNPVQQRIHEAVEAQRRRLGKIRQVWGKTRQVGSTTYWRARSFHQTAFQNHRNAFFANYDEPNSYEVFDIDKTFFEHLPRPLKPSMASGTMAKGRMIFRGRNSKCVVGHARNLNVGASQMHHFVHLTEVARWEYASEIQASLFPSISDATDRTGQNFSTVVIEGTSRYGGWWFKEFAEAAQRGDMPDWEFHFVPAWLHGDYAVPLPRGFTLTAEEKDQHRRLGVPLGHLAWRRLRRREYRANPAFFGQEYPLSWEESWVLPAGTLRVFDDAVIEYLEPAVHPGRRASATSTGFVYELGGRIEVWHEPAPGVFYDMGVDVSAGRTPDAAWTVAVVVRRDTLEQVAQYRAQIDPTAPELLDAMYWLGMNYNVAQINVDITGGWGLALQSELQRRSYPTLWRWRRRDDARERVSTRQGFVYSRQDKAALITNAAGLVARHQVVIHSETLLDELRTFFNIGVDEWAPMAGAHDDVVNAWMLALLAARDERDEWIRPPTQEVVVEPPPAHAVHDVEAELMPPDRGFVVQPWGFR